MNEFEKEMAQIAELGIKNNPQRLTYEREVRALCSVPDQLRKEGYSEEQIARVMHNRRRELGRQFKEAAPPLSLPQGRGSLLPQTPGELAKEVRSMFTYFSASESRQFAFFRISKEMMLNPRFQDMSTDAKLLYGLTLPDRCTCRRGLFVSTDHITRSPAIHKKLSSSGHGGMNG